jgi:hypothetical protein
MKNAFRLKFSVVDRGNRVYALEVRSHSHDVIRNAS